MKALRQALPIDETLPELLDAIRAGKNVLLRAPTGAGKTTRVPVAVDSMDSMADSIVMLEPRRIAARAAARRMAEEAGESVGDRFGYSVRFDDKTSKQTRVRVVTGGVFLRQLQDSPFLDGVGVVLFDEFHERSVEADLALAMTRRVQVEAREDLRIVVMSATLETTALRKFLGDPACIESKGRLFPVDIRMLPAKEVGRQNSVDAGTVSRYIRRAHEESTGDVLAFLPGVAEIRRVSRALDEWASRTQVEVLELFGELAPADQDKVFRRANRRRVVLATNIAETSLTLPGVTAVVDTGLHKSLRYDPGTGLDRLELGPISKSSARQRAGRAGRTAPGVCWRLWTEHDDISRPEANTAEIEHVDLASTALQLAAWGETRIDDFDWLEAPPAAALERSRVLLERLDAIETRTDSRWVATDLGKQLIGLPLHPRVARFLLAADGKRTNTAAATAAALLSERSPFRRQNDPHAHPRVSTHDSDILDELDAIEAFERSGRRDYEVGELSADRARNLLRVRDQIQRLSRTLGRSPTATTNGAADKHTEISRALLRAFPDRLAVRRDSDENRAVMVGGNGIRLARECGVRASKLFLCLDVDGGRTDALVRRASAVELDWLSSERLKTTVEYEFNVAEERVEAKKTTRFEDLALDSRPAKTERNPKSSEVLTDAARKMGDRALDTQNPAFASFIARLSNLAQWMPELNLPTFDEQTRNEILSELCVGRISIEELRNAPLLETWKGRLSWEQQEALERYAPEKLEIPSGSHVSLKYEPGRPPVLAARIQELFGLADSPTVAGGRVRVLVHLLAPNMRPQQVTDDLKNFWNTTYADVRKELRQRYPKHDWPEDPWQAKPSRRVGRPRAKT